MSNGGEIRAGTDQVRVEFALKFTKPDDLIKVSEILDMKGLKLISSSFEDGTIQVQINVRSPAHDSIDVQSLQKYIEQQTGLLVVVRGLGELQAAVAELFSPQMSQTHEIFGVVRLSQLTSGACYVDGLLEGHINLSNHHKSPGGSNDIADHPHAECRLTLAIHEFGDLSGDNFQSIGETVYELNVTSSQIHNQKVKLAFRRIIPNCNVSDMLGKSVALTAETGEHRTNRLVLCAAVLARASEISKNDKKVCACSGKTLWEERRENL